MGITYFWNIRWIQINSVMKYSSAFYWLKICIVLYFCIKFRWTESALKNKTLFKESIRKLMPWMQILWWRLIFYVYNSLILTDLYFFVFNRMIFFFFDKKFPNTILPDTFYKLLHRCRMMTLKVIFKLK